MTASRVPVSLKPARPRWRETLGLLARNPTAAFAAVLLLLIVLIAIFDAPLAPQGAILLFALVFLVINLIVDLLYSVIDPRIRR